ncbi:MAG: hypothetical protein ACRKGH_03060 [Dehalogenimonas sp.]
MNRTLYRCPRCEQPFSFAHSVGIDESGVCSEGYAVQHTRWPLHVCRRCGQYLCNPDAALDMPLQTETVMRRLTVVTN